MKALPSKIILALISLLLVAGTACNKKFESDSLNNNLPLTVPPGTILRGILGNIIEYPGGSEDKADQFIASNYTYYGDNKYWTGSASLDYSSLNNVVAMEGIAAKLAGSNNNPYRAMGFFLRAFFYVRMSLKVGDLPMTDALQGLGNIAPKYNTQKEIFAQSLEMAGFL